MGKLSSILIAIVFLVVLVAIGPIATIWAVNQLFPGVMGQDPYTFYNWLAVVILGAFFRANVSIKKD